MISNTSRWPHPAVNQRRGRSAARLVWCGVQIVPRQRVARGLDASPLPSGTTYWEMSQHEGQDCAGCGGVRVLHRLSAARARLAGLQTFEYGEQDFYCLHLRLVEGRWIDENGMIWSYQKARGTLLEYRKDTE